MYFGTGATPRAAAYFGVGSGTILLDDVGCSGTESRLIDCSNRGIGVSDCRHSEDAGVTCLPLPTTPPPRKIACLFASNIPGNDFKLSGYSFLACTDWELRLVGGVSVREGRVEVCVNGVWSTICDESWSNIDAGVICYQLGYPRES